MGLKIIVNILGGLLIITSIFDALKYTIQAHKINRNKSAKGFSRRFINWAICNDIVKLLYGIGIFDFYIIASSILALVCMIHLWFVIYWWYPYKRRGLKNFKRPSMLTYLINSWIPNNLRERL